MLVKIFEHSLMDMVYGALSNSILKDNKSISVKVFNANLNTLAVELCNRSLLFRNADSIDFWTGLAFGGTVSERLVEAWRRIVEGSEGLVG